MRHELLYYRFALSTLMRCVGRVRHEREDIDPSDATWGGMVNIKVSMEKPIQRIRVDHGHLPTVDRQPTGPECLVTLHVECALNFIE